MHAIHTIYHLLSCTAYVLASLTLLCGPYSFFKFFTVLNIIICVFGALAAITIAHTIND